MPKKNPRKKTRFVPRAILGSAALVSVVPAIALAGCGGKVPDAPDAAQFSVACQCVAAAFDAGSDATGFSVAAFGVSAPAFDAGFDAQPDATGFTVAAWGVAAPAFDAGHDAPSDAEEGEGGHDSGVG